MSKKLLRWLDKREAAKTLSLAREQMKKALDTVYELDKSIDEASQGDFENSRKSINRLFSMEEEVDGLRRQVFHRLGKVELSSRDREDLLHLVKRLDVMADYVKDSARSVLVLSKAKEVPLTIWNNLLQISKSLVKCASSLRMGIEKLEDEVKKTEQYLLEVDEWEHKIDEQNLDARIFLITESKNIDYAVLLILRDLLSSMEEVADSCADTADYLRVLIAEGLTSY